MRPIVREVGRGGQRLRLRHLLALALTLGLWLMIATSMSVAAASPGPSTAPDVTAAPTSAPEPEPSAGIIDSGDPRSNGQGPGLVGSPFAILLGVVLLGLVTAGGTLLFVRVTRDD